MKVTTSNPKHEYPYIAKDRVSENVYIVFSGPLRRADVMCIEVNKGKHWGVFDRRTADGSALVKVESGFEIKITQQ